MSKRTTPKSRRKKPRITRSRSRALIPLDTEKIRNNELKKLQRNKATSASLHAQEEAFEKKDIPAFRKWVQTHLGKHLHKINIAQQEYSALRGTLLLAEEFNEFYPMYTKKACADAAIYYDETDGKTPEGFEEFFEAVHAQEKEQEELNDEMEAESAQAKEIFDSFMNDLLGNAEYDDDLDDCPFSRKATLKKETQIKKLYRKIIRKLHPDRANSSTQEQQKLWHTAKKAYDTGDLETLEHIDSHCDLLDTKTIKFTAIDSIRSGIEYYKKANTLSRRRIRQLKTQPEWGFCSASNKKRAHLKKQYTSTLTDELDLITDDLESLQGMMALIQKEPKRRSPRPRRPKKEPTYHQDQNSFDFF